MIHKSSSAREGYIHVTFELPACLWADQIYVVGEFNDWDKRSLPMVQNRTGTWQLTIELPVGQTFEFRYLVDGRWLTDNHADAIVDNTFGSQNSLICAKVPVPVYQKTSSTK